MSQNVAMVLTLFCFSSFLPFSARRLPESSVKSASATCFARLSHLLEYELKGLKFHEENFLSLFNNEASRGHEM